MFKKLYLRVIDFKYVYYKVSRIIEINEKDEDKIVVFG